MHVSEVISWARCILYVCGRWLGVKTANVVCSICCGAGFTHDVSRTVLSYQSIHKIWNVVSAFKILAVWMSFCHSRPLFEPAKIIASRCVTKTTLCDHFNVHMIFKLKRDAVHQCFSKGLISNPTLRFEFTVTFHFSFLFFHTWQPSLQLWVKYCLNSRWNMFCLWTCFECIFSRQQRHI